MTGASYDPVMVALAVAAVGAILGGAIAHWKRGSRMIVTGALIGGSLFGLMGWFFSAYGAVLALGLFVIIIVYSIFN